MVELNEETKAKVLKQIEFYFSDSNLPKDKFLKQQVDAHPEGYVDLSLIVSFARMRDLLKLGNVRPEDVADEMVTAVADVLRQSKAVAVSESGFQVKRATPLPSAKEAARAVDSRSLYVRPFPMTATLDAITNFFLEQGVQLNAVRVRRHQRSKDFKGSIFLECESPQEADRMMQLHLEYEGAPLRYEKKQAYLARKIAERKAKSAGDTQEQLTLAMLEEMDSDCEIPALAAINNNVDAAALKAAKQQQQQQAGQKRKAPETADAQDDTAAAAAAGKEADKEKDVAEPAQAEPEIEQYEPGCITLLTLQGQPEEADHWKIVKMIKEALGVDKVRFVEQQHEQQQVQGQQQQEPEGQAAAGREANKDQQQLMYMVRFREPSDAEAALGDASADLTVAGCSATLTAVEGEEEVSFYKRAAVKRAAAARRGDDYPGRGRGRGGGRGGRGRGGRGRRGGGGRRGRY